jgi:hypothetical protein
LGMFNLRRILSFLGRFLAGSVLWGVAICILAVLNEVLAHADEVPDLFYTPGFWLSVVFNMVPAGVVIAAVFWLTSRFLRAVYGLKSGQEGMSFLMRSRFGQSSFRPWMKIAEGKIALYADSVVNRTGGPGNLIVYHDSAVVLERAGRLTRVEGPGFPKLDPFERIYDIIDLRPKRWVYPVNAMTKEGIPVTWDAEVHYQIADGEQEPTEKAPYPVSKDDIFNAATCKWRREASRAQDMDWEGRLIIGDTEGILRSIIARRPLDQLIGLTEAEERAARESVQEELEREVRKVATTKFGARIIQVKLDNFKVDDAVTQQWIEAWKTRWQSWSGTQLAQGEAARVYLHETAKAEAQARLLVNITRAFQGMDLETVTPSILMMRLFSALDRADLQSSSRVFVPTQALDTLNSIRRLLAADSDDRTKAIDS